MSDKEVWKNEVKFAERQLKMCKWYQLLKKEEIKAYIDIIKKMHNV